MSTTRDCDYSIMIVSNDYLKSPNCLFELIELSKEKVFHEKFVPIILDDAKIYSVESKLEIIQFWQQKVESTRTLINSFEPTKAISLIEELKHYETIYSEIDHLLSTISGFKNITFSEGNKTRYKDIIEYLGIENPNVKIEISRIQEIKSQEYQDIELDKLKKKFPGNSYILFAEGYINLTQRENHQKAKTLFEEYLKINLDRPGLNNMGLCLQNLGEFDRAEEFYMKALEFEASFETFFNLGNLESKRENYKKAMEHWMKSLEINPNDPTTYYNIGFLYTEVYDDFENGLKYYEKSIECDPHFSSTYVNISSIYVRQGKFENAAECLEKSIELNPDDYMAMYNLGAIYQNVNGKLKEAKSLYRRSIRENNNYLSPKIGLAKLLVLSGGDIDEAKDLLKDVLKIEPTNTLSKQLLEALEKVQFKK